MTPIEMLPDDEVPAIQPEPLLDNNVNDTNGFLDSDDAPTFNIGTDANANAFLPSEPPAQLVERATRKRVKMSKAMRKTMDGLKDKVADLPIMWFHDQAVEHPEWALDEKEQAWLRESINSVFEVLDIDVEIQPISMQLTSIWWVLGYPFVTFLFLFLIKKGKTLQQEGDKKPLCNVRSLTSLAHRVVAKPLPRPN